MTRPLHRTAFIALATALVAVVLVTLGLVVSPPTPAHAAAPSTGRYVPVDTTRVWSGSVGTAPKVVPIAGRAGVPAAATAVVVNVEVGSPTATGYVRVTPAGVDASVATQEFSAGQTISNLATVKLAKGGVQVKLSAGSGTVFMDVSGYYVDGAGTTYTPVDAARVFRQQVGTTPVRVPLASTGGVPADATAVAVNTQVEATTANGYVRVTPAGQDPQVASQVFTRGTAVSNLVIVKLVGGAAQVRVSSGTATVSMDVSGYYTNSDSGSVFVPIDTTRAYAGPVGTTPRTVRLTGTAGVPGTATAVVANAETERTTAAGYLRVTPAGTDAQVATQVFGAGRAISNLVMAKVTGSTTNRGVQAKVSAGTATLDLDVAGYFMDGSSGSGIGADVSWPQGCSAAGYPANVPFAIVGVNWKLGNETNPCLAQQLAWAASSTGGTAQAKTQLYVLAANPSYNAAVWPRSNTVADGPTASNPYGTCTGKFNAACSFMYGYTRAYEDATIRNVPNPSSFRWWLDVETGLSWLTAKDAAKYPDYRTQNRADIEGMVAGFKAAGVSNVGVYSNKYQFNLIAGAIPAGSPLRGLPNWATSGRDGAAAAQRQCAGGAFTPESTVQMTQWVGVSPKGVEQDYDFSCV